MDLVIRAVIGFAFVFFLTRVVGRRELSSLEPFDLIMLVMIGDLVQQGITQNDFSVTGMVLVGGTVALMTVAVSYGSFRFPRLRPLLEGEPVIVVQDGRADRPQPAPEPDNHRRAGRGGAPAGHRAHRGRPLGGAGDERLDQLRQARRRADRRPGSGHGRGAVAAPGDVDLGSRTTARRR